MSEIAINKSWHIEKFLNEKSPMNLQRKSFDSLYEGMEYIYNEITFKDSNMGDFFLHEYVASNCIEKDLALRILKIYTILDKINSIILCRNRKKVGSVFFKQSIEYLERNMKDGTRGYLF